MTRTGVQGTTMTAARGESEAYWPSPQQAPPIPHQTPPTPAAAPPEPPSPCRSPDSQAIPMVTEYLCQYCPKSTTKSLNSAPQTNYHIQTSTNHQQPRFQIKSVPHLDCNSNTRRNHSLPGRHQTSRILPQSDAYFTHIASRQGAGQPCRLASK